MCVCVCVCVIGLLRVRTTPHGVVANFLNCDILVCEFKFQSGYYV